MKSTESINQFTPGAGRPLDTVRGLISKRMLLRPRSLGEIVDLGLSAATEPYLARELTE
jgi:hypothetical protein